MDRRALIDERIRTLLTSTDLTFKQIIEQLRNENMPASFNTIRRVNRNHRYRKPRYDAKLTPQQRKELIVKLKNTTRPNLSSLARQYGVCHGSIWYWWDKLSKIREKNGGQIPNNEPTLDFDDLIEQEFMSLGAGTNHNQSNYNTYFAGDPDSDPLDLDEDDCFETNNNFHSNSIKTDNNNNGNNMGHSEANEIGIKKTREDHEQSVGIISESEIVGPVQAKNTNGEFVRLPIIMYAPISSNLSGILNQAKMKSISGASSSLNRPTLIATSSEGQQTGSLSKRLGIS